MASPKLKATVPPRTTDLRDVNLSRSVDPSLLTGTGPTPVTTPTPSIGGLPGSTIGGGPVTDPNSLDRFITPENTLRNQRLGFGVGTTNVRGPGGFERVSGGDTTGSIADAFAAQQPLLQQQFIDEAEALTRRTAAMGRTGSGLFNRETGFIGDRAIQAREALLGNLAFSSIQADAQRALQANLGNQGAGIQMQSLQMQNAQANAARALQVDLARQAHLGMLQQREDALARQAMQDQMFQMQLLQQGFQGDPSSAINQAANVAVQGSGRAGDNSAMINQQLGQTVSSWASQLPNPQHRGSF